MTVITDNRNIMVNIIFPLLTGALIYLMFRDGVTALGFIDDLHIFRYLTDGLPAVPPAAAPYFIKYLFTDFLWMYAFASALFMIWDESAHKTIIVTGICASMAIAFEVLQKLMILPGTYDILDITVMLAAVFAADIINIQTPRKEKLNEKSEKHACRYSRNRTALRTYCNGKQRGLGTGCRK